MHEKVHVTLPQVTIVRQKWSAAVHVANAERASACHLSCSAGLSSTCMQLFVPRCLCQHVLLLQTGHSSDPFAGTERLRQLMASCIVLSCPV